MFYIGATDQRVSVVNDAGVEIYQAEFRNFGSILTHLRGRIVAISLASGLGEIDKNLLSVLQDQMNQESAFKSLQTIGFSPGIDAKLLALSALVAATSEKKHNKKKKSKKKK